MTRLVTLHAYRFHGTAQLWALWQMGAARPALMRMPGLAFWKLCGSGRGAGFRPLPDPGVAAILAVWSSARAAEAGQAGGPWAAWSARADERCAVALRPLSSRGAWSGRAPFGQEMAPATGRPVAALTRATIRPRALGGFWGRVGHLDDLIAADPGVLFRIGIGELPVLRQGTFTVWPSARAMAAYARTGAHAEAIAAVRRHGWFREELYARFEALGAEGSWAGRPPLGPGAPGLAEGLAAAEGAAPAPAPGHRPAAAR